MTVAMRWNGMKQSYDGVEEYWCFANTHHCAWDLFYVCCCCLHRNQFRDKRDSILIFYSYILEEKELEAVTGITIQSNQIIKALESS